ncbi:MAG: hypothetical protein ACYS9X_30550 [Planctomycetota bacterium]|jgi:hypothetical protein
MPQRAISIVLAIVGLCAVAALAIAGADAWAQSRRGPRWWRRIVGAGLALAAMFSAGSCRLVAEDQPGVDPVLLRRLDNRRKRFPVIEWLAREPELNPALRERLLDVIEEDLAVTRYGRDLDEMKNPPAKYEDGGPRFKESFTALLYIKARLTKRSGLSLRETRCWKRIARVLHELQEIGAGRRGYLPFDIAGVTRLENDYVGALEDVAALKLAELLGNSEAALLKQELNRHWGAANYKRVYEDGNASCYMGIFGIDDRQESPERLSRRLDALKALASAETVRPAVVERALASVLRDLEYVREAKWSWARNEEAAEDIGEYRERASWSIEAVEERVPDPALALEDRDEWHSVRAAFVEALPHKWAATSTTAERKRLARLFDEVRAKVVRLFLEGGVSAGEAALVLFEAEGLRNGVCFDRPADLTRDELLADLDEDDALDSYIAEGDTPEEARIKYEGDLARWKTEGLVSECLQRLEEDIPRLKRAVERPLARPAVLSLLLPSVERDLLVFSETASSCNPYAGGELESRWRDKAEDIIRETRAVVAGMKAPSAAGGE